MKRGPGFRFDGAHCPRLAFEGAVGLSRRLGSTEFQRDKIFDKFDSSHCFFSTYRPD
jgi:hypothetical protein